ncbi:MAG: cyclic nucleotide-binding domain-containing protein [Desulfocapsaceae bacterium]|nr:cyclic nucleotide-binding domain-containing protein [Desulfocapsaceae bacterium]
MTDATSHDDALEALKAFNTAITTTRLYPADAPQVQVSVEKAYQAVKYYLRNSGALVFSIEGDEGMLCGSPIQKQTLGKLHGADVFQHLKILGLPFTVIRPGTDRKAFKQILSFFITSPQRIKLEGGGVVYAAQMGLGDVFPAIYSPAQAPADPEEVLVSLSSTSLDIQEEWITFLLGSHEKLEAGLEILEIFQDAELAARIITAGIARVLSQGRERERTEYAPFFRRIFARADEVISQSQKGEIALKASVLLLEALPSPVLSILLSQDFSGVFGEILFATLMTRLDNEHFREVIGHLKTRKEAEGRQSGDGTVCARLLDTVRGRQFLALEKARALMEEGEKERRNKRIQTGLNGVLQGNTAALQNDEVAVHLPTTVERLLRNGKDAAAALLIKNVAKELLKGDEEMQARLSQSLGHIGEILLQAEKWDWLDTLAGPLLVWVNGTDKGNAVYERILTVLQHIMLHGWRVGNNRIADQILTVVFKIRSGAIRKSPAVQDLTGQIQDRFIDRSLLPGLLARCLADPADETLGQRLSMQGPVAARFLIRSLLASTNAGERIGVLDLLANMGPLLAPVLIEQLPTPMPWYGKRNLLKLLAETGGEEHTAAALGFLNHDDLRVQREAFFCVHKISGSGRKRALLQALALAGEAMKGQVVKALGPLLDEEVIAALADLLVDLQNFSPDVRGPLTQQICRTLSRSPSRRGKDALENVLSAKAKNSSVRLDPEIRKAIEGSLRQIEINQRKEARASRQKDMPVLPQSGAGMGNGVHGYEFISDFPEELEIRRLLEQMNKAKAKVLLVDLIGKAARVKQFRQAGKLRDWLIQIDPMALTDIVRTAEIIENEKASSIDKDHLGTWFSLYDMLSTEEFNALYHSLDYAQYAAESVIVKQGDVLSSLFFINSGRVKLTYSENGSDTLVKIMGRGEVVGADSFFDASVWTVRVTALGSAEISVLTLDKVRTWNKEYPGLEEKLREYCLKFDRLKDIFLKRGNNRRGEERFAISAQITTALLGHGKDVGIITKGELIDISVGGLSCTITVAQKKNVRFLLGRNVRIGFPAGLAVLDRVLAVDGTFVAIHPCRAQHNEYRANIHFDQPFSKEDLLEVVVAGKKQDDVQAVSLAFSEAEKRGC